MNYFAKFLGGDAPWLCRIQLEDLVELMDDWGDNYPIIYKFIKERSDVRKIRVEIFQGSKRRPLNKLDFDELLVFKEAQSLSELAQCKNEFNSLIGPAKRNYKGLDYLNPERSYEIDLDVFPIKYGGTCFRCNRRTRAANILCAACNRLVKEQIYKGK